MHLHDHIQIIGKIESKDKMTCWKIIQKAEPNALQIGNIVYPSEEADDMLIFKSRPIRVFVQFSWV